MPVNRQFRLAARPVGSPRPSDFQLVESPIPEPGDGEVLLQTLYLSVDPYMRGRMNAGRSYARPVEIGDVMVGEGVCRVVDSRDPKFQAGDVVAAPVGWQEYAALPGRVARRLDPRSTPITTALGVLGMPGMTAYFGLLDLCAPKPGETVVVSAAAGAVGSVVGQIAKLKGCRAVGIAGGAQKVAYLKEELGFDAALDYKAAADVGAELKEVCPRGIDVYFDNVGGPITDAVFPLLNERARVSICGLISQYNLEQPDLGPRLLGHILVRQLKVEGFIVSRFIDRWGEGLREMSAWVRDGKVRYRESIVEGFENTPRALLDLFAGRNFGKHLVKVADG